MPKIYAVLIVLFSLNGYSQGSGNCLEFDGNDDVVEIPNFPNQTDASFTICAWINSSDVSEQGQRVFCDDQFNQSGGYAMSLGDPGTGRIRFYMRSTNPVILNSPDNGRYRLENDTWYHIAVVHSASTKQRGIYINGQLAANDTYTSTLGTETGEATIGGEHSGSSESANRFRGKIDEVSFWSTALSRNEVRDLMCQSLTGNEANLVGYWTMDQASGSSTLIDQTGNGYDGNLTNMDASTDWITSGAAIGDESTYLYTVNGWAGQSISLNSTSNGSVTLDNVTYTQSPKGIHLYRVDNYPNHQNGINPGLGSNNVYYGIYVADPRNYDMDITYDYSNYPDAMSESGNMILYRRDNNAGANWSDHGATDNGSDLFRASLSARIGEFTIASSVNVLPIELLNFSVQNQANDQALIEWETGTEINNSHFEIYRSEDGSNWSKLGSVEGAGNSSISKKYALIDPAPYFGTSYYRLYQYDFDGTLSKSDIRSFTLMNSSYSLYPNPSRNGNFTLRGDLTNSNIQIFNTLGEEVPFEISKNSSQNQISISTRKKGMYFIQITNSNSSSKMKLVIE